MALHYILYGSQLTNLLTYEALRNLLDISQRNNCDAGLTGFLHIEGRVVLQFLEGPQQQLEQMIQRIRRDPRHTEFVVLEEGTLERRYFESWNMALVEGTTLSLRDLDEKPHGAPDFRNLHPTDLIALLSANASYLHNQPRIVA